MREIYHLHANFDTETGKFTIDLPQWMMDLKCGLFDSDGLVIKQINSINYDV